MPPPPPARASEFRADDAELFGGAATGSSRLLVRGRGPFQGWRRRAVLGEAVAAFGAVSLPVTFTGATGTEVVLALPETAAPGAHTQGREATPELLVCCHPGSAFATRWPAHAAWWNMSVPAARLARAAQALHGAAPAWRGTASFAPLPPGRRQAIMAATRRAMAAPPWVEGERLADGLLALLLPALLAAPPAEDGAPRRRRAVEGLVAIGERAAEARSLVEVCAELDVPLRTLNAAANAFLGVSAAAYLRARRMARVRAALLRGAAASVTEAAMREGFWELGRFSAAYRARYGEAPSATLRRAGLADSA